MNATEKEMIRILEQKGYGIIPPEQYRIDMEEDFRKIWTEIRDYTMTSVERGYALYKAVRYVIENDIAGDFVECGVWKGGSCMLMALVLMNAGIKDRNIYLYDTFKGMTEPGDNDFIAWNGRSVRDKWDADLKGTAKNFTEWAVSLDTVKANTGKTGYPAERLIFIKGPVEETLPADAPDSVCLLRLDTDWYESTRVELEHLYPVLSSGGVLILDDYGHFTGAKLAVDEYFSASDKHLLLNRIDYTGRIAIKP